MATPKEPIPVVLSLADQYRAMSLISRAEQLFLLDGIWTNYLDQAATVSKEDAATLKGITEQIKALMSECSEDAQWAHEFTGRNLSDLKQGLTSGLENAPPDLLGRDQIREKLIEGTGLADLIEKAASELPQHIEAEKADIAAKMDLISRGNKPDGDMSPATSCLIHGYVLGVSVGVGLLYPPELLFALYQGSEVASMCF